MAKTTTIGQVLIDNALPEDMRRGMYDIDKKSIRELLRELYEKHPDEYRDVVHNLMTIGHYAGLSSGSSLSLKALTQPPEVRVMVERLKKRVREIAENDKLDPEKKEKLIIDAVFKVNEDLTDTIFNIGKQNRNPFAIQAMSGSRGNKNQLRQLVAGDGLVSDYQDKVIPVPILNGYAQGLDPVEYFAGSYGARKGSYATKKATADAGFMSKQLAQATHRLVVTEKDCATTSGISVPADDPENVGTVLARDTGDYEAGTLLTADRIKDLKGKEIRVRSPITCQSKEGVCAKCAGAREKGRLPDIGDQVGIPSSQAISERISQGMLSSKHTGGQVGVGPSKGGFDYLNQLIQVPGHFHGGAPLTEEDGHVTKIEDAPQGGKYVWVGEERYYVSPDQEVTVKIGEELEAGDALSNGTPNPALLTKYKGIGQARRQYVDLLKEALENSGVNASRRNLEVLSRGLINHVKVTDPDGYGGFLVDDIVPFDAFKRNYSPRKDAQERTLARAKNTYLESPVLHYTIGTRLTPRVINDLKQHKINTVVSHNDPPPFEPVMVRAMENLMHDPDWQTRFYGSYLGKGFLESVHRARTSNLESTSFVPSLIDGSSFGGKTLKEKGLY